MNTLIRKSNTPFYGDRIFPHGLSRSGLFNKRESEELEVYGQVFASLADGTLLPENEEEIQFVSGMFLNEETSFYPVKLWKKYLDSVEKSKKRHGFANSNGRFNENVNRDLSFA